MLDRAGCLGAEPSLKGGRRGLYFYSIGPARDKLDDERAQTEDVLLQGACEARARQVVRCTGGGAVHRWWCGAQVEVRCTGGGAVHRHPGGRCVGTAHR